MSRRKVETLSEVEMLRERISQLEQQIGILLSSNSINPPIVDGVALHRCACGKFGTRIYSVSGLMGTAHRHTCDACPVTSPYLGIRGTEVQEIPHPPRVAAAARALNASIEKTIETLAGPPTIPAPAPDEEIEVAS